MAPVETAHDPGEHQARSIWPPPPSPRSGPGGHLLSARTPLPPPPPPPASSAALPSCTGPGPARGKSSTRPRRSR
jgi:hypothetical protein